jgi:hypothetical protein
MGVFGLDASGREEALGWPSVVLRHKYVTRVALKQLDKQFGWYPTATLNPPCSNKIQDSLSPSSCTFS